MVAQPERHDLLFAQGNCLLGSRCALVAATAIRLIRPPPGSTRKNLMLDRSDRRAVALPRPWNYFTQIIAEAVSCASDLEIQRDIALLFER